MVITTAHLSQDSHEADLFSATPWDVALSKTALISDAVLPYRIEEKDLPLVADNWLVTGVSGKERTKERFRVRFDVAGVRASEGAST